MSRSAPRAKPCPSPASPHNSEWLARQQLIDPELEAAGWTVRRAGNSTQIPRGNVALTEYPTANGPADYALCSGGRVLAIVEAKKVTLGAQGPLTQAERYAAGITQKDFQFGCYGVPFAYSTNGEGIWFRDLRNKQNLSRTVAGFHTPAAFRELLSYDFHHDAAWFSDNPIDHPRIRDYQTRANEGIEKAIQDRKRAMLVAMATGTGKTFTLVHQIYRLMKAGVARRVLFLVDRRALAAQAVRAFHSFDAEPALKFHQVYEVYSQRFQRDDFDEKEKFDPKVLPKKYLTEPGPQHAFVYVCTIQRMSINLFGREGMIPSDEEDADADAESLTIPIHAFDVIVADECHRGYTAQQISTWRNALDHFDAIKIGLTATPAAHTTSYFQHLVFRYGFEEAVRDGFLVDYDAVKIESDVRLRGVFLKEGEQVDMVDPVSGARQLDLLEDERQFSPTEVEQTVTSPDSNRKILAEIAAYAEKHVNECGRFPKTLIFAANDLPHTSHADQLVKIAREVFNRGETFVQKITGKSDRPLQRIREFRNRPEPGLVVTVDLLSTGVDIPDLEFIVFLRPVQSRILFEQMMGRGTRKGERFPDKSHFVVFDCFGGTLLQRFERTTGITLTDPVQPSRTLAEIIEDIWQNRSRDYNVGCLVKRLQRTDKQLSGEAREHFAAWIPDGDLGRYATALPRNIKTKFTDTMKLLRAPAFQDLLANYPRTPRQFLVAEGYVDTVTSEELIGNRWKPDEYLKAFEGFVQEHRKDIEAIRVLLEAPEKWSPEVLSDLRDKLRQSEYGFTVERLQKAHEKASRKAMADIISIVKHAVRKQEPLLTAQERVERALTALKHERIFTPEQEAWLERLREHLILNLALCAQDFDGIPVLCRAGGFVGARRMFEDAFGSIVEKLNHNIAKGQHQDVRF